MYHVTGNAIKSGNILNENIHGEIKLNTVQSVNELLTG